MQRTADMAIGKWHGILTSLGIDNNFLRNRHGECPLCGGRDRWRWDDRDGRGTYYCNHCGSGDGMKLAMLWTGLDFKAVAARIDGMIGNIQAETPKPKKSSDPMKILRKSKPADGVVAGYLKSRGLEMPQYLGECAAYPYWEMGNDGQFRRVGDFPCMVGCIRDLDGNPTGAHITFLAGNGKARVKSAKKINGEVPNGAAVRLYDHDLCLGIAEGIETAIAAKMQFSIPVWAALNSGGLEKWLPPAGVESVVIFGDNDGNYAGQKAAYVLANRLCRMKFNVEVRIPVETGDWADEL